MTSIAKITDFDLASLQRLRAESSHEGFRFMERLCEEWVSGVNRFDAPGEALFIARVDAQVVGICGVNRDPYARNARTGRVRRLYVLPGHRRNGVGGALLEAAIAHARGHFDLVRARTEAADHFYTARGFQRDDSHTDATHVLQLTNAA
jgi:GNAT superfamily N-acetyltransferase